MKFHSILTVLLASAANTDVAAIEQLRADVIEIRDALRSAI